MLPEQEVPVYDLRTNLPPEITQYRVSPDGKLTPPLDGHFRVTGPQHTVAVAVRNLIGKRYFGGEQLQDADVIASITKWEGVKVEKI